MSWDTSNRRGSLPKEWHRLRQGTLKRAGYQCQHLDVDGNRCQEKATHADHITPHSEGGTDDYSNMQALCPDHHATKSSGEGGRAAARIRAERAARFPIAEEHPASLWR